MFKRMRAYAAKRWKQHEGEDSLMREALDEWSFVTAAYIVGIAGTLLLTCWSWLAMRRAEKRRDVARKK